MPTPSPSWNSVRVHGTWVNQDGSLKAGSYKVSIPVRVTNDTDDVIIPSGTFATGTLNTTNGLPSFDLQIPATDDPDNSPPFQVRIEITFPDALGEMYQIDVPVALKDDAKGLDLEKVVLTSTFTPVETLVKGIPGGVAELDSAGFVLDASGARVTTAGALLAANNLSDVPTKATARTNLGLGTAATHPAGDFATPADLTALSATYAAKEPRVVQFALLPGVDRTGATASDAAFASVVASASHALPVVIEFGPGSYKFTAPWGQIDQTSVMVRGAGSGLTTLDFSSLTSGPAMAIWTDQRRYAVRSPLRGIRIVGPSDATVDGITFGGAAAQWSPFMSFYDVEISGFGTQVTYGMNTWAHYWASCQQHDAVTASVNIGSGTNMGENLAWSGCLFYNNTSESIVAANSGLDGYFHQCSFDYAGRAVKLSLGVLNFTTCHFEGDDARRPSGVNEFIYVTDTTGQRATRLLVSGGQFYPAFTTRPNFVTVTGAGNASVHLKDVAVGASTALTTLNLVADASTAPADVVIDQVMQHASPALPVPATAQYRTVGNSTVYGPTAPSQLIASVSGQTRQVRFGTLSGGVLKDRWAFGADATAETGTGNIGSNFQILCRDDNGSPLYTPLAISRPTGFVTFGRGVGFTIPAQTLAAAGAITFNAFNGTFQEINLQANCTSSSIINPNTGNLMTISWVQDATGGRSYVWPTNCKFAGASAPADTTANRRTSVTFYYNGGFWFETSRAVAVG